MANDDERVFVMDPQGVVFASNRPEWLYHTLTKLSPEGRPDSRLAAIRRRTLKWTGLTLADEQTAVDRAGVKYLVGQVELDHYPGWKVLQLRGPRTVAKIFADPLLKYTGYGIVFLCMLVGLSAGLLYWRASHDLVRRQLAEQALMTSEARYRSIYNSAPAMPAFHRSGGAPGHGQRPLARNPGLWRDEVIGHQVTDFFSEASRHYAGEAVFPDFFRHGFCKDISYQYLKKNGEAMDVVAVRHRPTG